MSRGLFGSQFDYNQDGELNAYERAEEYSYFEMLHEDENTDENDDYSVRSRYDYDDEWDDDEY